MNTNRERERETEQERAHTGQENVYCRGRRGCQCSEGVWQLTLSMHTHGNAHTGTHSLTHMGHTESNCCSCLFWLITASVFTEYLCMRECVCVCLLCGCMCDQFFVCSCSHTSAVNRKCLLLHYVCYSRCVCVCAMTGPIRPNPLGIGFVCALRSTHILQSQSKSKSPISPLAANFPLHTFRWLLKNSLMRLQVQVARRTRVHIVPINVKVFISFCCAFQCDFTYILTDQNWQ